MTARQDLDDDGRETAMDDLRRRYFWQNLLYVLGIAAAVVGLALLSGGCASVGRVGVGATTMQMRSDAFGSADRLTGGTLTIETIPNEVGGQELGADLGQVSGVVRGFVAGGSGSAPVPSSRAGAEADVDLLVGGLDLGFRWEDRNLRLLGLRPYLEAGASWMQVRADTELGGMSAGAPGLYAGAGVRARSDAGLSFDLGVRQRWTAAMDFDEVGAEFDGDALELALSVGWGF